MAWAGQASAAPPEPSPVTCALTALPGLSSEYRRTLQRLAVDDHGGPPLAPVVQVGLWTDYSRVVESVLGPPAGRFTEFFDYAPTPGVGFTPRAELPCGAAVRARDTAAWAMSVAGYSATEIADAVGGHLTRAEIDRGRALLMVGRSRQQAAAFLESRWRSLAPDVPGPVWEPIRPPALLLASLDADILALAREHRVPPDLARAVIAVESGGNPRAVSRSGAIGLMQLMPATARALGVDPWQPLENLRGGISYLGSLLRLYGGNIALALVAYNAGPQHADRVRDGRAVVYRESRAYLDAIAARYPALRP
jgi:soluble lytic murein transglycosylase-like protein